MDFASIRMITDDLEPAVQFYERVTGVPAARPAPVFAELHLPLCAIPSATPRRPSCSATPPAQPTTMAWGNRSILFPDPDGNLVNLFTPVTEEAIERSGS